MSGIEETVENFARRLTSVAGLRLSAPDLLLLESYLHDLKQTGSESILEQFRSPNNHSLGIALNFWLESLYDHYGKFFADFRDFKTLRHVCIASILQQKRDKSLTIWCVEQGKGQEAYSLGLMIHAAIPELADWKIKIITTNQSSSKYLKCMRAQFTGHELSQGLPESMVDKLVTPNDSENLFNLQPHISAYFEHKHLALVQPLDTIPLCDIVMLRGVYKYLGKQQAAEFEKRLIQKIHPRGFLLLSRQDPRLQTDQFASIETSYQSALYQPTGPTPKTARQAPPQKSVYLDVSDLSAEAYRQMTLLLKEIGLMQDINIGETDDFLRQFPLRQFSKDDRILHEGEPNSKLMGVIDGSVSIWVGTGLIRKPLLLTTLGPGQLIGESSALTSSNCTASVVADSSITVFEINRALFEELYNTHPKFSSTINSMMRRRHKEREVFKKTQKSIDSSPRKKREDDISLIDEGRYILDAYSLPDKMKLTTVTPELLKQFKKFSNETSLFEGLSLKAVETIANLLCAVEVEEDVMLIKEGTWPVGFYLVCEGEADIYKGSGIFTSGKKVAQVRPGSFIGEMSVILNKKASASVISTTSMTLCALSRELFEYLYNSQKEFSVTVDELVRTRKR